jgi:hypothetical protein
VGGESQRHLQQTKVFLSSDIRENRCGARGLWAPPEAGLKPRAGLSPPSFEADGLVAGRQITKSPDHQITQSGLVAAMPR